MKKDLMAIKSEEMKNQSFEVLRVTEKMCELCDEVIDIREKVLRTIHISNDRDCENLLTRSKAYDRVEVDLQEGRIYFYDHDYPGEVHPRCVEKLG